MRRLGIAVAALLLLSAPVAAEDGASERAKRYAACLQAAHSEPAPAVSNARTWVEQGGGDPARHCLAVALLQDGRHTKAARKLMRLGRRLDPDSGPVVRAEAFAQAGQAWLLAGNLKMAETAHTKALELRRGDAELWIDRAMVRFQGGDNAGAIEDLNRAQSRDPDNAMVYVYRASALRHMEQPQAAMQDVNAALDLAPGNPEALLEKGNLHRLQGEPEAAREAWRRILEVAPNSRAAESARTNLTSIPDGA